METHKTNVTIADYKQMVQSIAHKLNNEIKPLVEGYEEERAYNEANKALWYLVLVVSLKEANPNLSLMDTSKRGVLRAHIKNRKECAKRLIK